jgi:hypothetical protein
MDYWINVEITLRIWIKITLGSLYWNWSTISRRRSSRRRITLILSNDGSSNGDQNSKFKIIYFSLLFYFD